MVTFRDVFSGIFQAIAVTATQDLFELVPDTDEVVALLELHLSQTTDLGDAAEEVLRISVARSAGAVGSGGASVTPAGHHANPSAFGGTMRRNDTTPAATQTVLQEYGWNVRVPFEKIYTPETLIWMPPAGRLCIGLLAAPADSITMSGTLVFGVL